MKKYKNLIAIDNISIEIHDNEIFGLLGPNGAGKTTLIHILATLIKPTSGTASVNGYDILNDSSKVRSSIGIVFQAHSSDNTLTGYENLNSFIIIGRSSIFSQKTDRRGIKVNRLNK